MNQTIRKSEIIALARRDGKVTVEGLVEAFGVTHQTIRRDLTELADAGRLDRVHGGAILPSTTVNIGYADREGLHGAAKADIARACAAAIPNDCAVFLNIGTTTEAVARALSDHEGLLVVTNNINVAMILSDHDQVEVIVTGGSLRRSDGGLIGQLARDTIAQFRFDVAVVGCSALGRDGSILDFDIEEVAVSKAIIARSDTVFLAADSSKFDRKAPARIGSMSDVSCFFTEAPPPADVGDFCAEAGVDVVLAGKN
ncbi:MAG: DeoR/GlpR family DNA-binding transcription regulator [Pseudomonadota bacterium]